MEASSADSTDPSEIERLLRTRSGPSACRKSLVNGQVYKGYDSNHTRLCVKEFGHPPPVPDGPLSNAMQFALTGEHLAAHLGLCSS